MKVTLRYAERQLRHWTKKVNELRLTSNTVKRLTSNAPKEENGKENASPTPLIREKGREENSQGTVSSCSGTDALSREDNHNTKRKCVPFIPPTLDEVRSYCTAKGYADVNPEKFHAYYESNGWYVGRRKMKSWQSALTYWHSDRNGNGATKSAKALAPVGMLIHTQSHNEEDYVFN